jgi:hypothetical protein
MFVQVIKGRTNDAAAVRRQAERWRDEIRPGAVGFLGSTAGVADDGTFVVFARFADEASAKANSERPEQGAWWSEMAAHIDGEPTFLESSDAEIILDPSDDAGFVQVMEGTVTDRARAQALEGEMIDQLRSVRPDLLGSVRVWLPGDAFIEAAYFTSEEEARKGESSEEFSQPPEEFSQLYGEMTFLDLRDPLLTGP